MLNIEKSQKIKNLKRWPIIKTRKEYNKYKLVEQVLKFIELLFLGLFIIFTFWVIYTSFCAETSCSQTKIEREQFSNIIQISIPLIGIVACSRMAAVYRLNDPDDIPEKLYYSSLTGFSLFYIIIGSFNSVYLKFSEPTTASKTFWLIGIIIFTLSILFVLADRVTWNKASSFVRWRLGLIIIHQILFITNFEIGLIATSFIYPMAMLINAEYAVDLDHSVKYMATHPKQDPTEDQEQLSEK